MNVRDARPADLPAIGEVAERSWTTDYPGIVSRETAAEAAGEWYGEKRLATELNREDATVLVAEQDAVVGFVHAVVGDAGNILRLYVDPDHRGEGIGGALLAAVQDRLFEQVDLVRAMVLAENGPGNEFYRAHGFRRLEETFETRIGGDSYEEHVWVRSR